MAGRVAAGLVAVGLVAAACTSGSGDTLSLEGTSWVLASMAGVPVLEGSEITASFTATEVSGSGGCNLYGGMYELNGETMTIAEPLMSTLRACVDVGRMEQESAYLSALGSAQRATIEGDTLAIETAIGRLRYLRAP